MLGNATLTIVASRNASNAPKDATTSAAFLLTRRSAGEYAAADTFMPRDPSRRNARQRSDAEQVRALGSARMNRDGVVTQLADLALFADLSWPELELVSHTFE